MKDKLKLLTILIITLYTVQSFAQTACNKEAKIKQLMDKEGISNSPRWQALKAAKFYWWRRCQCESGKVIDAAGEKFIIEYLARGYDNFERHRGKFPDIPAPDKRDFKIGECFSGTQTATIINHSDCQSINIPQQEDPQRYITQYKIFECMCNKGVNSKSEEKDLIAFMQQNYNSAKSIYTGKLIDLGPIPTKCNILNTSGINGVGAQNTTQQQLMQSFANYSQAMNLKKQGEGIAKAYANQVKSYSQLNKTVSPEALLQDFNKNMQAITDLQTQNKADNLNQVINTISTSINNYNTGNHEGGLYSALSLLDQGDARREAKRKVEQYKASLIAQAQNQMNQFYWKAVQLNSNAIDLYYQKAAYAFTKEEENYLLEMVKHHECFASSMNNNFKYSNTSWTINKCPMPNKAVGMENKLMAADLQYIQTAKRKYQLYIQTGKEDFQQGAMKFAGLAANTNPKKEYYYLMGHFAGANNALVAYSSFLTAQSKSPSYFKGEKTSEFYLIKQSLEREFKNAIEENNQEVIANIVGAGLHQAVSIDGNAPIVYAISIDQANVVQAFLNAELDGKTQSVVAKKIKETIMLAASLDAPSTIEQFANMGIGVDFKLNNKTPLDVSEEALALNSFSKIEELLGGQMKYTFENSDLIKIRDLAKAADVNNALEATKIYNQLASIKSTDKAINELLYADKRGSFFSVYKQKKASISSWKKENEQELFTQCVKDLLDRRQLDVWEYFENDLINLNSGINLIGWQNKIFNDLAIDVAIRKEHSGVKDLNLVTTSQSNTAMTKFFIKADKSSYSNYNFDSFKYSPKIVKDLTNESDFRYVNLVDFAIERRDKKLVQILLNKYQYSPCLYGKFPESERTLVAEGYDLNSDFLLFKTVKKYGFWSQDTYGNSDASDISNISSLSIPLETEYEIIQMLIFEFGYDKDAIRIIADYGVFKYGSRGHMSMYPFQKKLIDELIENGHSSSWNTTWLYKHAKASGYQEFKTDKKYWKAIVLGNYDKRY